MQQQSLPETSGFETGKHAGANARYDFAPSLTALKSSWPNLVADLGFEYGSFNMRVETSKETPRVAPNANWVQVAGNTSAGPFNLYLPARMCAVLLEISHSDLDIAKLEGTDAALVLEFVFSDKLAALENVLGLEINLLKVADVTRSVDAELLGLELSFENETHLCALEVTGQPKDILETVCANFSNPDEKSVDRKLVVHLGPVVVPAREAYLARIGEAIDCGVEPSDIIRGVLMRSDGRYWPIHIEDEEVEIVGELAKAVSFPEEQADQIFVTFGLGDVSLGAFERSKLEVGSRLQVNRIADNGANVYYQAKPFGQGHLAIMGSNLAVNLDRIGTFNQ